MDTASCRAWFEHLSSDDERLLEAVATRAGIVPDALHADARALAGVLAGPDAYETVCGDPDDTELLRASPFLTFAVIVHRAWVELQGARHVDEWVGPRQRLPVLGGDDLRAFLATEARRLFLTELLASYTRVASGATWVRTRRGWRRRRFSELDPVRLAALLEVVPERERAGVYRRLGDLALFLTGVFPDHTALHGLGPHAEGRLARLTGVTIETGDDAGQAGGADPGLPGAPGAVGVLERLGARWYRLAAAPSWAPRTTALAVVVEVAERFGAARRTLNYLTDRHLFTRRARWFGDPA